MKLEGFSRLAASRCLMAGFREHCDLAGFEDALRAQVEAWPAHTQKTKRKRNRPDERVVYIDKETRSISSELRIKRPQIESSAQGASKLLRRRRGVRRWGRCELDVHQLMCISYGQL
jgi:hypothetical protein